MAPGVAEHDNRVGLLGDRLLGRSTAIWIARGRRSSCPLAHRFIADICVVVGPHVLFVRGGKKRVSLRVVLFLGQPTGHLGVFYS